MPNAVANGQEARGRRNAANVALWRQRTEERPNEPTDRQQDKGDMPNGQIRGVHDDLPQLQPALRIGRCRHLIHWIPGLSEDVREILRGSPGSGRSHLESVLSEGAEGWRFDW